MSKEPAGRDADHGARGRGLARRVWLALAGRVSRAAGGGLAGVRFVRAVLGEGEAVADLPWPASLYRDAEALGLAATSRAGPFRPAPNTPDPTAARQGGEDTRCASASGSRPRSTRPATPSRRCGKGHPSSA